MINPNTYFERVPSSTLVVLRLTHGPEGNRVLSEIMVDLTKIIGIASRYVNGWVVQVNDDNLWVPDNDSRELYHELREAWIQHHVP